LTCVSPRPGARRRWGLRRPGRGRRWRRRHRTGTGTAMGQPPPDPMPPQMPCCRLCPGARGEPSATPCKACARGRLSGAAGPPSWRALHPKAPPWPVPCGGGRAWRVVWRRAGATRRAGGRPPPPMLRGRGRGTCLPLASPRWRATLPGGGQRRGRDRGRRATAEPPAGASHRFTADNASALRGRSRPSPTGLGAVPVDERFLNPASCAGRRHTPTLPGHPRVPDWRTGPDRRLGLGLPQPGACPCDCFGNVPAPLPP